MRSGLRFDLLDVRLARFGRARRSPSLLRRPRQASPPRPSARRPGRNHVPCTLSCGAWREGGHDVPVILRHEVPDREFAVDDHRERRSLHTADRELLVARERVGSGQIHADQPVGAAASSGGIGERIVLARVLQLRKAIADGFGCERRDPEALDRLVAAGRLVDVAKDQLAFASGIRGADDARRPWENVRIFWTTSN